MYKRMLVLLDGSELAEDVFGYAIELSGRLGMEIELLNVVTPQDADELPMRRAYIEHQAAELCEKAEAVRLKYSEAGAGECIRTHGSVVVGYPADEILNHISEHDIDLVMLSTHGRSGMRAWHLGSVANRIVHATDVPVWLVPSEVRADIVDDTLPGRNIVVPLSGTKMSEAAIPHAVEIVKHRGAEGEIVLLHVENVDDMAIAFTREAIRDREREHDRLKKYLETMAESVRAQGVPVRTELIPGDPPRTIIQYLSDNPANLLVMSTRGHRGLSRMIFGSTTESVIHLVKKTPLLLVEAQDDDD